MLYLVSVLLTWKFTIVETRFIPILRIYHIQLHDLRVPAHPPFVIISPSADVRYQSSIADRDKVLLYHVDGTW